MLTARRTSNVLSEYVMLCYRYGTLADNIRLERKRPHPVAADLMLTVPLS
jgi:hypothetical protein